MIIKSFDRLFCTERNFFTSINFKKVFEPSELILTDLNRDLIFLQIINDFSSTATNTKIRENDKIQFKKFLGKHTNYLAII